MRNHISHEDLHTMQVTTIPHVKADFPMRNYIPHTVQTILGEVLGGQEGLDPAQPTLDPKLVSHVLGYIQLGLLVSPFWISTSDSTVTLYNVDIPDNDKHTVKQVSV